VGGYKKKVSFCQKPKLSFGFSGRCEAEREDSAAVVVVVPCLCMPFHEDRPGPSPTRPKTHSDRQISWDLRIKREREEANLKSEEKMRS